MQALLGCAARGGTRRDIAGECVRLFAKLAGLMPAARRAHASTIRPDQRGAVCGDDGIAARFAKVSDQARARRISRASMDLKSIRMIEGEGFRLTLIVMPREGGDPVRRGLAAEYERLGVLDRPAFTGDEHVRRFAAARRHCRRGRTFTWRCRRPRNHRPLPECVRLLRLSSVFFEGSFSCRFRPSDAFSAGSMAFALHADSEYRHDLNVVALGRHASAGYRNFPALFAAFSPEGLSQEPA